MGQATILWLDLPRDNKSDIKYLIFSKVGEEELQKETGLQKFMKAKNEAFQPSDEPRHLEIYNNYYVHRKKKTGEEIRTYLNSRGW